MYYGVKNFINIIFLFFMLLLKLLFLSLIIFEQKIVDVNKGIKIVEIIILKQNGEDEIMLGLMFEIC